MNLTKTVITFLANSNPARHCAALLGTILALASPSAALATANYVYHERTANNPGCGTAPYVDVLVPTSSTAVNLRFKIEYQFYTDNLRVYYTTDGSTPSGSKGVASGTT